MTEETVNVARARKHFSELLDQVAFGKKHILITKRGKPMARLVPTDEPDMHLCDARGWLENSDPFFDIIEQIILDRSKHVPRMLKEIPAE